MKTIFETILPARIDNTIRGMELPFYVFALYSLVSFVRSCLILRAIPRTGGNPPIK